jgi:YesN/AraC family two-component response regulator
MPVIEKTTKILVVEDEHTTQNWLNQSFRRQIRACQYQLDYVDDGQKALEKIRSEYYDLALIDIKIPEPDGLTLLNLINQQHINLKSIIISAYGEPENYRRAIQEKADDFLVKPFPANDLAESIERVLKTEKKPRIVREQENTQDLDSVSSGKPSLNVIFDLAELLTPTLQFRLITRLIPNLNLNQIKKLEENFPFWITEAEKRQIGQREDKKERLLQALKRTNSFIEERPITEESKKTGELRHYYYLYVRWKDPNKKTLVGISISSKDLQDPQIRYLAEKKLGKKISM